ncbi:PREDICTED: tudor domain-containing protein 7A [Papilio polytes]|uniref:tudor domain-containing protein 7A n=1 Tax=Papilio polytes TaxID=76194 RepID=UPI0006763427|nr:PREDICTED: tudor domain-containing protein 7A [Papilio polytes]
MADKDQVIQALRATLISVKGALTIKQCNRDYRELQGEWIPFKKLGYPTLEKLFQDVPGFKISQINGEWYVDAIASQETQHIASMVARQKSTKKTNVKLSSNRFPKKQGSWRKPASTSSYPSSYDKDYSKQFYRYKTNTSFNSNPNPKFQSNKYNKVIETKNPPPQQVKQPIKVVEQQEKVAPNVPKSYSAAPRDSHTDKLNHSKRNEKESEPRAGKMSASQRLFNLRDRLSTVDLIPLQLPAHNNYVEPLNTKENMDPVTQVVPAHNLEPPPESTSSQEKLEWTCRKLGLPQPVYNLYDYRPKKGPVTYDCTVKVGSTYSVSSYPDSSPSEQLAREVAAAKVLAMVEGSEVQGLPTAGAARALQALADLVAEHEAGLWASIVPHMYREKYNENLPNNWQELVENCPRILKDRVVNGLLVLLPNNKEAGAARPPQACAPAPEETIDSDLPPLQFPDQDFWNVFITVANSTLEVWLRIIGIEYSNMLDAMLIEMAKYYEHFGTSVDKSMIIKNAWYAVNLSDGGWQRAKVLDLEKDTATVFLGDHGDDDTVNITNIKILEPQFRKLPAQAILCRLEGAEEPVLPAPGKCFDVYIAMAANPWNFIVQSNTNRYTLQTMMMELQRECPKLSADDAPTAPANGELFTAYYPKDSSWYRVTIAGTVSTETVSIYFCDFGDLALFAMKDLRPVPASVPLARSLPPQAIKGKLFDVRPLYQDWTVEDCIRFQELCVEQQFVGICKEVDKDPLNPKEPLLILDLIDTSTDEDIYLNKQLVAEGRARLASDS